MKNPMNSSFNLSIDKIKATDFYKSFIAKLFLCVDEEDRIVFETKKAYTREEFNTFEADLGEDFPYILFDIDFMEYYEDGEPSLKLREVE